MANEITVDAYISVANGNFSHTTPRGAKQFTQAMPGGGNPGTVNIGTSDEAIALGDITTPGWCYARNLDATNYVDLGPDASGSIEPFVRLEPGEMAVFRVSPAATLRGQANTAAVNVQLLVFED